MKNQEKTKSQNSRRRFLSNAAAFSTIAFIPSVLTSCNGFKTKFDSNFGGIQVGTISYSFRSMPNSARDILNYLKEIGLSSVELMGGPIEQYAGAPEYQGPVFRELEEMTVEQRETIAEARRRYVMDLRDWRLSVSMDRFRKLRKIYNEAGVDIYISKLGNPNWSDEEIDYAFNVARTLGSKGITFEISLEAAKRMAPFADKHGLYAIMHNHGQLGLSYEEHLAYGQNLMLNFDVGHYYGATGLHPNSIIEKFHDRIVSLHIKDKTGPNDNPPDINMPFGQGSTPLADVLMLIKKNDWPIAVDIELAYPIPAGSDAVSELKKCVDYCKAILLET